MKAFDRLVAASLPAVPRLVVRKIADRYIAGETLEDAVATVRGLNALGAMATVDVLGEFISRPEEAEETATQYERALDAIAAGQLDANVSVKLSALGIEIDRALVDRTLARVLRSARRHRIFVRIDMEHSGLIDETLDVYRGLRGAGHDDVGIVIQSYMRRAEADVAALADLTPSVRLVKGIYLEPEDIAYQAMPEINASYLRLLEQLVDQGSYVAIATHDPALLDGALNLIDRRGLGRDRYEFQMLLGVAEEARRKLISDGHRLRVYVPYGRAWYAYSVRRLKENPSIAGYVARDVVRTIVPGMR
ncbi:MAG TPA: proline dehydrogenase family protein [Gaiellales bacterium]|nr:proline dehydrogenase family protein [Gaiellales bacterium]